MMQRKHTFRLRVPRLFAPSSSVSKTKDRSKFPTHSDTNVPIQTPTSPTTKTKEPSNFEPQKNSPSHHTQPTTSVIIESTVPFEPRIPTPVRSPLPSRVGSPSCVSIASSSPKTRLQSPFHLTSDGIIEVAKLAAEESFWPTSSAFEQEKEKKIVSKEPIPQEVELKESSLSKANANSPLETIFQPEKMEIPPQDTEQKTSFIPSTPISKTELASDHPPPPPSSPLASEHTGEALKRNAEESALLALLASKEEKNMLVSQATESTEKSPLEAITKSPETSFQPENMSKQPQETEQKASSELSTPILKIESNSDQPSHTSSPLASIHIGRILKCNAEENTLPKSPTSQEEKERMMETVSDHMPQEGETKLKSPLKTTPKSPESSFHPSSAPSSPVSKIESASDQLSHPSSPLAFDHISEALKPDEESPLPTSSTSQEEKERMVETISDPVPQEDKTKLKSPLKTTPKLPETSFHPSSIPSFSISKIESASDQLPHPSPPLAFDHIDEALKAREESPSPSSTSQEEKEKLVMVMSERVSQEVEPKIKSPLKTIPKSPKISSKTEILHSGPTPSIGNVKKSPTPKTKKSQNKLLESEEKDKKVHEPIKSRKARGIISTSQPIQHTMESDSGSKAKDPFTRAFHADKKQHEAGETVARRLVFATSKLRERNIKFMSSPDQMTKIVPSRLPQKASLQNGIKKDVSKFVHNLIIEDPKGIKDDVSKFVHELGKPKQPGDDKQFSAIALAGENRGATMQLGSNATKNDSSIHIHQDYKADSEEIIEVITDLEEKTKKYSNSFPKDSLGKAYVNSNVQSINNSLMVHGSVTESG